MFPLLGLDDERPSYMSEPARRFVFADGNGAVGIIASVTEPFCDSCDRVRVTSDGKFRTCLFANNEFDLRAVLRDVNLSETQKDERLAEIMHAAVATKVGRTSHWPSEFCTTDSVDESDWWMMDNEQSRFSHLDEYGQARMVDVTKKLQTRRRAVACARVHVDAIPPEGLDCSLEDLSALARVAALQAAKRTAELIPLCHPLLTDLPDVRIVFEQNAVVIEVEVETVDRTGVEMEALVACAFAARQCVSSFWG